MAAAQEIFQAIISRLKPEQVPELLKKITSPDASCDDEFKAYQQTEEYKNKKRLTIQEEILELCPVRQTDLLEKIDWLPDDVEKVLQSMIDEEIIELRDGTYHKL